MGKSSQADYLRGSAIGAVSFFLSLWFGLFPLFEIAHFAFADHKHRFCEEHLQIEEVPHEAASDSDVWLATAANDGINAAATRGAPPSGSRLHIVCTILNGVVSRYTLALPGRSVSVAPSDDFVKAELSSQSVIYICAPLFNAPKTSPPLISV